MSFERRVRVANLPAMRLAFFEHTLANRDPAAFLEAANQLWDAFNAWRDAVHPALGRIDIAAIGWGRADPATGEVVLRACVPVRGDYDVPAPARSVFFPGGRFAYCYADDAGEVDAAFDAVSGWLVERGIESPTTSLEVYRFHYNLDQHPCDCGFLLEAAGPEAGASSTGYAGHAGPLPIAGPPG